MNKKYVIAFSLLALSFNAKAKTQTQTQTQTSSMKFASSTALKPYIGIGSFSIDSAGSDFSAKNGIVAGAAFEMTTPVQNLYLDTGLEYIQAGAKREYVWISSGSTAISQELNLSYLAIPVKARYQFLAQPDGSITYQAIGGLTVAQMISAKSKTEVFGISDESDVESEFNKTDLLASIGVGAESDMMSGKVSLDVEYTRGLLDVSKDGGGHNQGFIIKAGYSMSL